MALTCNCGLSIGPLTLGTGFIQSQAQLLSVLALQHLCPSKDAGGLPY